MLEDGRARGAHYAVTQSIRPGLPANLHGTQEPCPKRIILRCPGFRRSPEHTRLGVVRRQIARVDPRALPAEPRPERGVPRATIAGLQN